MISGLEIDVFSLKLWVKNCFLLWKISIVLKSSKFLSFAIKFKYSNFEIPLTSILLVSWIVFAKVKADLIPVKLPGPVITKIVSSFFIFIFALLKIYSTSITRISEIFLLDLIFLLIKECLPINVNDMSAVKSKKRNI